MNAWTIELIVMAIVGPLVVTAILGGLAMYSKLRRLDTEVSRNETDIERVEEQQTDLIRAIASLQTQVEQGFDHLRESMDRQFDELQRRLDDHE